MMKNYLVIGGSSAVGTELIQKLLDSGATVYSSYHSRSIPIDSDRLVKFALDVTRDEIPDGVLPETLNGFAYLPGSIQLKPFKRIGLDVFKEDFELQVLGAIRCLQSSLKSLTSADDGSVLFYSTVAVQRGFDFHSVVSTSKGALEGLTKALSAELAPKIRVNCITPSLTRSALSESFLNSNKKMEYQSNSHPLKRIGEPTDIAELSHFLLSERSSWMTGQILHLDGGRSTLD